MRERVGAGRRALTCSALKPQGIPASALAALAHDLALGGLDYIKDDHGLADQRYSPFHERVAACADSVERANRITGGKTRYVPSIGGNLDQLRHQIERARGVGVSAVLVVPMIAGLANFHALVREFPGVAFMTHPAMAGASRIAPPLLLGKLFRLFGADATVFPNHGGRFGYSPETCRALAAAARSFWGGLAPTMPVPAGGMTTERVAEMLAVYGPDTMLLIGGALLSAQDRLTEATRAFSRRVADHVYA
jgi:ribulose-bisphosphate carboxylase large chain